MLEDNGYFEGELNGWSRCLVLKLCVEDGNIGGGGGYTNIFEIAAGGASLGITCNHRFSKPVS